MRRPTRRVDEAHCELGPCVRLRVRHSPLRAADGTPARKDRASDELDSMSSPSAAGMWRRTDHEDTGGSGIMRSIVSGVAYIIGLAVIGIQVYSCTERQRSRNRALYKLAQARLEKVDRGVTDAGWRSPRKVPLAPNGRHFVWTGSTRHDDTGPVGFLICRAETGAVVLDVESVAAGTSSWNVDWDTDSRLWLLSADIGAVYWEEEDNGAWEKHVPVDGQPPHCPLEFPPST